MIITVEANNLTDRSYELVEMLERRRKWLNAIVVTCFIFAPIGIGINAYFIIPTFYQKGAWSDANIALMGIVFAI